MRQRETAGFDAGPDGDEHNLYLVTTYAPLLSLIARAMLLLTCWHVACEVAAQHSVVCAVLATLAYLDCRLWHGPVERACGCLVVCAVALQTHAPPAQDCSALHDAGHWVLDLAWAALSLLPLGASVLDVTVPLQSSHAVAAVSYPCLVAHTALACTPFHASEWAWRIVAYIVACAIAHFGRKARHLVPHTCVHILFAHLYVVFASGALLAGMHVWLAYRRAPGPAQAGAGAPGSPAPTSSALSALSALSASSASSASSALSALSAPHSAPSEDLLLKLRAAKAQHRC